MRERADLQRFQAGEVLVAAMTDPDWEPVMKRAAAIVTDRGGRTCHAAIVSRELGVPCVVGTERATATIADGDVVTVSCAQGETGAVYRGALPFERRRVELSELPRPATAVMLNVGNPDQAFRLAALPNDGVGLARIEFIIANAVRAHPMALLHPDRVTDAAARAEVAALVRGHASGADYFVDRLAEGVAVIAAAFHPKDVIVRLSDFKSNEYAGLLGGRDFEPVEENPMLGFRGAYRYAHPRYREAFALECRAMRRVREDMGLTNLKLMIPFCRTPDEGRRVVELMADARAAARRARPRDLRDVRDPVQRDPGRGVRGGLRRLLDRLQRSHAAHARARSGLRPGGAALRRAQPGRAVARRRRDRPGASPRAARSGSAGRRPATIRSSRGSWSRRASTASR